MDPSVGDVKHVIDFPSDSLFAWQWQSHR